MELRSKAVDKVFDYQVPAQWESQLQVGQRVEVPFGRVTRQGLVVALRRDEEGRGSCGNDDKPLKFILDIIDDIPLLTKELMDLSQWLQGRYGCTWTEALSALLPAPFHGQTDFYYTAVVIPEAFDVEAQTVWRWLQEQPRSGRALRRRFGPDVGTILTYLQERGAVIRRVGVQSRVGARKTAFLRSLHGRESLLAQAQQRQARAPKQSSILQLLSEQGTLDLRALTLHPKDTAIQAICREGLAQIVYVEQGRRPDPTVIAVAPVSHSAESISLTSWQQRAIDAIGAALQSYEEHILVLHGVTGSGKTEVYLQSIEQGLHESGGALVLVPEIALTPQMVGRFQERFGDRVAILHSGLGDGERRDEWLRVLRGEAPIVVGARSAVFAPLTNLRLIVVDEEHEPSYKQGETPYYDARDVALWRAQFHHATVILGSATPSLEAMHRVTKGEANLLVLPERFHGRALPPIEVVDMREELRLGQQGIFSRAVNQGIADVLAEGNQAILFLNRRGYAAFVLCRSCGETLQCPHCDISLTLHRDQGTDGLHCHYCGYQTRMPAVCPHCGEPAMRSFGLGTQQVEAELRRVFPAAKVLRMDVDTTRRKGSYRDLIESFLHHEADILVGTQMVAKGLDFPDVTFVGVIAADTLFSVPDFRAAERTFQLLTQVSGRAGRAQRPGRTVVQTYRPDHYAIVAAAQHNQRAFYMREMELRREFVYPPFCELAVFMASHPQEQVAHGAAARFEREVLRRLTGQSVEILPAVPAGVLRVGDHYRYQVVVKYSHWQAVGTEMVSAYRLVLGKMIPLHGTCTLDVNAGRI